MNASLPRSPFDTHKAKLDGCHSAALRLQRIVLNLYNGNAWPIVNDELSSYLSNADHDHRRALLEMLNWYAQLGENCPDFMALGRRLAKQACREQAWNAGYDDAYQGKRRRSVDKIPHEDEHADAYEEGFRRGQDDRSCR